MMTLSFPPIEPTFSNTSAYGKGRKTLSDDWLDLVISPTIWAHYESGIGSIPLSAAGGLLASAGAAGTWAGVRTQKLLNRDMAMFSLDFHGYNDQIALMFCATKTPTFVSGIPDQDFVWLRVTSGPLTFKAERQISGVLTTDVTFPIANQPWWFRMNFSANAANTYQVFQNGNNILGPTAVGAISHTGYLHVLMKANLNNAGMIMYLENEYGGVTSGL